MKNNLFNKIHKFLNIFLDKELTVNSKIKKIFGKKEEETTTFDLKATKEEFDKQIIDLINGDVNSHDLATGFCVLIQTKLSILYKERTLTLLENLEEPYINQIFEHIVKFDNLVMCEDFLNNTNKKYKNILALDSDYPKFLTLSVESGSKNITEYFLKNKKFTSLLSDPNIVESLLYTCLSSKDNRMEITNMLLLQDINLSKFYDKENSIVYHIFNSEVSKDTLDIIQKSYNSDVIKQIKKKLLQEELNLELDKETPKITNSKKMKL